MLLALPLMADFVERTVSPPGATLLKPFLPVEKRNLLAQASGSPSLACGSGRGRGWGW